MRNAPRIRAFLTLGPLVAALTAGAASAQDLSGIPRHIHDATGSDLERAARPDMNRVFSKVRSEKERLGLAGAPTVEVRRNFVYTEDTDGTLTIPYQRGDDIQASFEWALQQVYRVLPDEFVFVYLFTSFPTGIGAYFYSPMANTDSGIGQPRFDNTGPSPLAGFVFMNYWRDFDEQFGQFGPDVVRGFSRSVFNQEAGHRWGVQFDTGPGVGDGRLNVLLGRDQAHWSYFLDTGGSPMEGNSWRDNGNGTFTTRTSVLNYDYCDADLYLMGLIPPDQVRSMFVIESPQVGGQRDIYNQPLGASSPPQIFDPLTISGTRTDFTIDDFTSRLGTRSPVAGQAPTEWRVVFVMLAGRNNTLSETSKVAFENMVDGYMTGFHTGTRNLGTLDGILMSGPPKLPIGGLCSNAEECNPLEATLCTVPSGGGSTFCTRGCSSPASCPTGWCCGPDGQGVTSVCQPAGMCGLAVPDGGVPGDDAGTGGADAGGGDNNNVCTCDLTTLCDESCPCDPECRGDRGGCGCTTVDPRASAASLFALFALAWVARRRRAR
ncbi:MAG: hypothetical protein IT384_24135 [Deltaproteobacteria bacterium]|nr:hypothetical protein [Deltaproteobacteria bacterium]